MRRYFATLAAVAVLAAAHTDAAAQPKCSPTRPDMLGPFYTPDAPQRDRTGDGLTVHGAVRSASDCGALPRARIEWWSANTRGEYHDTHRATQVSGPNGEYRYVTDMPGRYPGRPPHLHIKVSAPGHRTLVTQIYPKAGQREIPFDFVLQPD